MSIRLFGRGKKWDDVLGRIKGSEYVCVFLHLSLRSIGWAGDGELMQGAAGVISLINHQHLRETEVREGERQHENHMQINKLNFRVPTFYVNDYWIKVVFKKAFQNISR